MIAAEIVDLAVVETADGSEVPEWLMRLADWERWREWRRAWRAGTEWCCCAIPEAIARAIRARAMARHEALAA